MRFLIVIPAHNEEKNIGFCLKSLFAQTYCDFKIVVVDDGSDDNTLQILQKVKSEHPEVEIISLPKSAHEPGAKVVKTFNKAIENQNINNFEIICKFDGDIIFPPNYLEELYKIYRKNPKAGMVSGLVKIKKSVFENNLSFDFKDEKRQWTFENISSHNHVRGPIKSYSRACFLAIGGLRRVLGWDNIDVMLAKKHGFEVITVKNLWVKHLRPTAYKYKGAKAEKLGEYFYNIGLNLPLAAVSSLKSSFKNKSVSEFFQTMGSFLKQKHARHLSPEEISYIRKLRRNQIFKM